MNFKRNMLLVLALILVGTYIIFPKTYANEETDNLNAILDKVIGFPYQDDPHPNFKLSKNNLEINIGDQFDISLLNGNDEKVDGVNWYIITRIPQRAIFTPDESQKDILMLLL